MSTPSRKTRPARANSLQRMLELERRYMMERSQQAANSTSTQVVISNTVILHSNQNSVIPKQHLAVHPHRTDGQAHKDPWRDAKLPTRPAPRIATHTVNPNVSKPKPAVIANPGPPESEAETTIKIPTSPDKTVSKIVSFDVPANEDQDDRRSICQSPSWEAYDRRKKEKTEEKKDQKKDQKRDQKNDLKRDGKKEVKDLKKDKEKEKEKEKGKEKDKTSETKKDQEKEEASKAAVAKKKRLSKNPPTSSTSALNHANHSSKASPIVVQENQRPRPASATDPVTSTPRDESSRRRSHSRSSSLSSLFRRPFESRRNSVDATATAVQETGFIGGIKLEMERHAALQKALDEQMKSEKHDEANIHPALRTSRPSELSNSPSSPSHAYASGPSGAKLPDSQRRAYPPITRLTNPGKTRSLGLPNASLPEVNTMDRWKAFVGMKRTPKQDAVAVAADANTAEESKRPPSAGKPLPSKTSQSPQNMKNDEPVAARSPSDEPKAVAPHPSSRPPPLDSLRHDFADRQRLEVSDPIQVSVTEAEGMVPPLYPDLAPPEPPQRSPKRNSLHSLNGFAPPVSSSPVNGSAPRPLHRPDSSHASTGKGSPTGNSSPGSAPNSRFGTPNLQQQRDGPGQKHSGAGKSSVDSLSPGDNELASSGASLKAARQPVPVNNGKRTEDVRIPTWDEIKSTVMQTIENTVSLSPVRKSHSFLRDDSDFTVRRLSVNMVPVVSSSDDLSSDEFHSPSMPGTPDTSRPQSEKGAPPIFTDIEQRLMSQGEVRLRSRESPSPVREAQKMAKVVRAGSELDGLDGTNFLPKLKHQPLKPAEKQAPASRQMVVESPRPSREKMMANQQPWPASYLEEARKATPLAPPPQVLRSPQLTPKGTTRSPPPAAARGPSSPAVLHHTSSSQGSVTPGADPIAKMFVECCGCKYYHDMPSNLYEVMANPEAVIPSCNNVELSGMISMTVRCPWCNHEMSTRCCAGYAAMVYVKQRLH